MCDTTTPTGPHRSPATRPGDLDDALRTAIGRTAVLRQCFYLVVLATALAGQVTGAVHTLHTPPAAAIPAVAALELGGVVVLANADLRRRLGERALGTRLLSALIAAAATTFNALAHPDHLTGGFYAGMSTLGYLVWTMHAGNQRRDRLRATGHLPPTTPAYELLHHWARHPRRTLRARSLAKADPSLDLYSSLTTAQHHLDTERRHRTITAVLRHTIRTTIDPATADLTLAIYNLNHIADRLTQHADYDTLTTLITTNLTTTHTSPRTHNTDTDTDAIRTTRTTAQPGTETPTRPTPPAQSRRRPARTTPTDYQPTSDKDAAMYAAWQHHTATGRQPSGADLARAAGQPNDNTGIGRRAARRYRQTHHQQPTNHTEHEPTDINTSRDQHRR